MERQRLWLRIAFGYGALVDAIVAIQMMWPRLFKLMMPVDVEIGDGLVFGMRFGVPLMLGWTGLLVWAALRPLERRGIALLTLMPVVVGYTVFFVWVVLAGMASPAQLLPAFASQALLYGLLTFGYLNGKGSADPNRPSDTR